MHNARMYGMVYPSLPLLYEKFLDRTLYLFILAQNLYFHGILESVGSIRFHIQINICAANQKHRNVPANKSEYLLHPRTRYRLEHLAYVCPSLLKLHCLSASSLADLRLSIVTSIYSLICHTWQTYVQGVARMHALQTHRTVLIGITTHSIS